jgi:hypothetical protein
MGGQDDKEGALIPALAEEDIRVTAAARVGMTAVLCLVSNKLVWLQRRAIRRLVMGSKGVRGLQERICKALGSMQTSEAHTNVYGQRRALRPLHEFGARFGVRRGCLMVDSACSGWDACNAGVVSVCCVMHHSTYSGQQPPRVDKS